MVKGSTYYAKLDAGVSLTGYTGSWNLTKDGKVVKSGIMLVTGTYVVVQFSTDDLSVGKYFLVCLVTFPDSFVQAVHEEEINLTL